MTTRTSPRARSATHPSPSSFPAYNGGTAGWRIPLSTVSCVTQASSARLATCGTGGAMVRLAAMGRPIPRLPAHPTRARSSRRLSSPVNSAAPVTSSRSPPRTASRSRTRSPSGATALPRREARPVSLATEARRPRHLGSLSGRSVLLVCQPDGGRSRRRARGRPAGRLTDGRPGRARREPTVRPQWHGGHLRTGSTRPSAQEVHELMGQPTRGDAPTLTLTEGAGCAAEASGPGNGHPVAFVSFGEERSSPPATRGPATMTSRFWMSGDPPFAMDPRTTSSGRASPGPSLARGLRSWALRGIILSAGGRPAPLLPSPS